MTPIRDAVGSIVLVAHSMGLLKARFDTLEHAQQVAAAAKDVTLRPYECTRIRGTYHLTSKPLRQEKTE